MTGSSSRRPRSLARLFCVAFAALALSGCVIVPEHGGWRPWPGYYHYR